MYWQLYMIAYSLKVCYAICDLPSFFCLEGQMQTGFCQNTVCVLNSTYKVGNSRK